MKLTTDISQRTIPTITIVYSGGTIDVPITPASRRRFRLMQEDCIELSFSLAQPISVKVGDYIQDAVFGRFIITEEQLPKYSGRTGGYDYTLRFDAEYMGWKNWIFCLAVGGNRTESRWNLTDRLDTHAQQIADNVNDILNPTRIQDTDPDTHETIWRSQGYGIKVTAENAAEIKHIAYNGTDIISALNMIAEEWSCEWWVDGESVRVGDTIYAKCIHFGKCEDEGEAYEMTIGENVETMDIARDQQDYCNRLFAYGGTQNIPEDYDKRLEFTVTTVDRLTYFMDNNRQLTLQMIDSAASQSTQRMVLGAWTQGGASGDRTYTAQSNPLQLSGKQQISIDLSPAISIMTDSLVDLPTASISATLHYGNNTKLVRVRNLRGDEVFGGYGWFADLSYDGEIDLGSSAVSVYLEVVWSIHFTPTHSNDDVMHSLSGTATVTSATANKTVKVVFNGTTTDCTFEGATGHISPKPDGMRRNSKYTIANLIMPKVPLSWFTADYDAGSLATAGEGRLHLPRLTYPNGYIDTIGLSNNPQRIVERVVVFDKVFPELRLRIKEGTLHGEERQMRVDYSDDSVSYEDWTEWSFEVEMLVDRDNDQWQDFPFRDYYILDFCKLQAVFQAPTNINATGHLLAGMTFHVGFNGSRYTIIRNEDYGALLPNDRLVPTEHDELVLVGWNPRYISDLDMVDVAEQTLAAKGNEYLAAIKEGQFTITTHMMSDTFTALPFATTQGNFGLLREGSKVTINHAALPNGNKTSRIIGYEYKLDIPFDTPTYIVGETEAYSRLKQIEKQLTKL